MRTLKKIILSKLPGKVINGHCPDQLGPYLHRWYLFPPRVPKGRPSIMLHCFFRSDDRSAVHDHPFSFITFPLQGYIEHYPDGTSKFIKPFRFYFRPAEWQHWVEVVQPKTWTIIFKFRSRRPWGFITKTGWVDWRDMNYREGCE